jgi:hypothetical protein
MRRPPVLGHPQLDRRRARSLAAAEDRPTLAHLRSEQAHGRVPVRVGLVTPMAGGSEPRLFYLVRHVDQSGVSGTGRVLDGVVFHTGQVVVCWRSDTRPDSPGYSSIAIYASWEAFLYVHVRPHPAGATEIQFIEAAAQGCTESVRL